MTLQQKRQGGESGSNKGACAFTVTEITARPHIPTLGFHERSTMRKQRVLQTN